MDYQELKKALRYEYQLKTGECFMLECGNSVTTRNDVTAIFDLDFKPDYNTTVFCNKTLKNSMPDYEVFNIITITELGNVFRFESIEEFVTYVGRLGVIQSITKY